MKNILRLLWGIALFCSMGASAQGPGDESDQGNLEDTDTPATPIDGNLLLLGAAGMTVAFYGLAQKRKVQ